MRQIKAHDVKPGMEIEWTHRGVTYRCLVDDLPDPAFHGWGGQDLNIIAAGCPRDPKKLSLGCFQEVTVLAEPQPDEPTAFGACVEVAGVKYVRNNAEDQGEWEVVWFSEYRLDGRWANTWEQICERGPVTVINPDPFANTEPREPRVWDRWADVPDRVTVRLTDVETPYRKVGDRIECKRGGPWVPAFAGEHDLNNYSPFTEVL